MFRLAEGLIPNIPDKKSESSAEPADIILRWEDLQTLRQDLKSVIGSIVVTHRLSPSVLSSHLSPQSYSLKKSDLASDSVFL